MDHPRISQDPAIMGGKPCIKGTRIPVEIILDYLGSGSTIQGVLEGYPSLAEADIRAALAYAADYLSKDGFIDA